jgi:hypothetical protein
MLEAKIPDGPLQEKWSRYRSRAKLVNPANRKHLHVIVVGTGLSGSSLAASLGEAGYQVNLLLLSGNGEARSFCSCAARCKRVQKL